MCVDLSFLYLLSFDGSEVVSVKQVYTCSVCGKKTLIFGYFDLGVNFSVGDCVYYELEYPLFPTQV